MAENNLIDYQSTAVFSRLQSPNIQSALRDTMFQQTEEEIDRLIGILKGHDLLTKDIERSETFLAIVNTSDFMITLHDVDLYRPVCINNKFKVFYGFENNWLSQHDLLYYIKTIHVSNLHTLVKSVVFFKQKNHGYLNLTYKLLHRNTAYKDVIGTTKMVFAEKGRPKFAITVARVADTQTDSFTVAKLTKREKEIVKRLVNGSSRKEIADALYIAEHTVHTHTRNIYKKLNINKIQELILLYEMFVSED